MKLPRVPLGNIVRSRTLPWALTVLAVAVAVLFLSLWRGAKEDEARREEVAGVARSFLVALTNFSADTIEDDVAEIRAFATGEFADEVEETFSDDRIQAIRDSAAESVGEVRSVFVQKLEGATASVFGVVDEEITNESTAIPRNETLRVEVGLIRTTEGWKVATVEVLQSPTDTLVG